MLEKLDTRRKILTREQALALKGCCAFVAYFDVLTVPLVRRLKETGEPVLAVLPERENTVLTTRTRAELAASLACVAGVVCLEEDPSEFLRQLEPVKIIRWEREDAQRTALLIEHVQSLQNA